VAESSAHFLFIGKIHELDAQSLGLGCREEEAAGMLDLVKPAADRETT
jgi:hypothetical protein